MRRHRFYSNIPLTIDKQFILPKEASHHCVQVLRYQVGAELILFNGDGFDYLTEIKAIEKKDCHVKIIKIIKPKTESPLKIHLFQGIARGEKMDLIIQKSVELGVFEITPLFTERCNVKLDEKRLKKKLAHWQKVIISACEQSGRAVIPQINHPINIKSFSTTTESLKLCLHPCAKQKISEVKKQENIELFIGPEGGFSDIDLKTLDSNQCRQITMGSRILRTETAGLVAIASLQTIWGDF